MRSDRLDYLDNHAYQALPLKPSMPRKPGTVKSYLLRIRDEALWRDAKVKAAREGKTLSGIIFEHLRHYVGRATRRRR